MVTRIIEKEIEKKLSDKKLIALFGARQTGKTTLLANLIKDKDSCLQLNGDDPDTIAIFENANTAFLKQLLANKKILFIDEAQRISDIGIKLKIIVDQIPLVKVIVTGSSAFELANKINEPLTGRKWEFTLYPFSFEEMVNATNVLTEKQLLEHRLIFGYYPDVVNNIQNEKEVLKQLTDSFLYKDILQWQGIQKPDKLIVLLKALAYQVGSTVSYNELANLVGVDKKTIEKYIDLLKKVFVIFSVNSYSRNLRNELTQSFKIYFFDNGIRNALIAAFQPIENRQDVGALWENFLMSERQKFNTYHKRWVNTYFWRTTAQQEIDLIEEADGELHAFEFKWNETAKAKFSKTFTENYKPTKMEVIHKENYWQWLMV
jgi:predicted AAA+ superfamily ATPase